MCSVASVNDVAPQRSNSTYDVERVRNPEAHKVPRAPLATFRFDCVDRKLDGCA